MIAFFAELSKENNVSSLLQKNQIIKLQDDISVRKSGSLRDKVMEQHYTYHLKDSCRWLNYGELQRSQGSKFRVTLVVNTQ